MEGSLYSVIIGWNFLDRNSACEWSLRSPLFGHYTTSCSHHCVHREVGRSWSLNLSDVGIADEGGEENKLRQPKLSGLSREREHEAKEIRDHSIILHF